MKEWLQRKFIPKPAFLLVVILLSIAFILQGGLSVLKIGIHYATGSGESMKKTLSDDSNLLLMKSDFKKIKRGDLVSIKSYNNGDRNYLLKRIIALPNETIKIQGNKIYINEELLNEPYAYYSEPSKDDFNFTVPSDGYFVMGDNRMDSFDSRILGAISKTSINSVVLKFRK
ncbi:signal peptidase I [Clostridium sp.]|uniref:signal peptidase I n=1 Tax=Clostridium sp. TaxID=1506 RepID=UPI003463E8C6